MHLTNIYGAPPMWQELFYVTGYSNEDKKHLGQGLHSSRRERKLANK